MRRLTTAFCALLATLALAASARALDSLEAYGKPGNALVAPFDAREGKTTFLIASNVGKEHAKLTTHWAFWSGSCDHLADVSVCLTKDDTVVVDTTAVQAVLEDNSRVGPTIDLSGNFGFVSVTAFETNDDCEDAGKSGGALVDDALVGSVTIADMATGTAIATSPVTLGLDATGSFTDLPDVSVVEVNAETFAPGSLDLAVVYAFALEEHAGERTGFPGEIGPITGTVLASAAYFDTLELRTSLPDLEFGCAAALDIKEFLDPLEGATSGVLRLSDPLVLRNGGSSVEPLGGRTGAFGILAEALGSFAAALQPTYKVTSIF